MTPEKMREVLALECHKAGAHGIGTDIGYDLVTGGWPQIALAAMSRISSIARDEALEEAARGCDGFYDGIRVHEGEYGAGKACAARCLGILIRHLRTPALKGE